VIAKLDNCNDNNCRHGWSEQEIHKASFPKNGSSEVAGAPWNQWITGNQFADNLFLHSLYCKRATIRAIVENTLFIALFANPNTQIAQKPCL
jgi:hypothetical protein